MIDFQFNLLYEPRSASLRLNWPKGSYGHALKLWVMLRLGDGWLGLRLSARLGRGVRPQLRACLPRLPAIGCWTAQSARFDEPQNPLKPRLHHVDIEQEELEPVDPLPSLPTYVRHGARKELE